MPYTGDGKKYSEELVVEHVAGQHEGYLDPNCRRCRLVADLIRAEHRAGKHRDKSDLCIDCEFPEELAGHM